MCIIQIGGQAVLPEAKPLALRSMVDIYGTYLYKKLYKGSKKQGLKFYI